MRCVIGVCEVCVRCDVVLQDTIVGPLAMNLLPSTLQKRMQNVSLIDWKNIFSVQ
jgi:hypothetical protein